MSATIQETLSVSRSEAIEVIAALQAAGDIVVVGGGDEKLSREECSESIGHLAARLRNALLGEGPEKDGEWEVDPTNVELLARSSELEAEMIDAAMQARVRAAEISASLEARDGRSAKLREYASRARDAGTEDVQFPTVGEMSEKVRAEMNARFESEADDAS